MIDNACTSFTKKDAIAIASEAFVEGVIDKKENIIAGYKAGGIWPVSFPQMQSRWKLFNVGGVDSTKVSVAPWITAHEVI